MLKSACFVILFLAAKIIESCGSGFVLANIEKLLAFVCLFSGAAEVAAVGFELNDTGKVGVIVVVIVVVFI